MAGRRAGLRGWGMVVVTLVMLSMKTTPEAVAQMRGPIPNGRLTSGMLSFDGHATMGDFTGTTRTVTGQLTGAPDISTVRGWVEAPVQSLKTGDRKRDKDLNKSMESSTFPNLRFDLNRIAAKESAGDSVPVTLHGTLTIHGVTRRVELPGTIEFKGTNARVHSDFPLNLKEYGIGGLSKMLGMLKMHENIEVHVDLVFGLGAGG
ncbi:MAG: YceI family protein [Actinomycetota bacterium]|nr:YceI family protein [Actinomycetota bacterium]